jgi:negative regulator of flagellin synthesis FlgM
MIDGFGRNQPPRLQGPANAVSTGPAASAAGPVAAKAPAASRTSAAAAQLSGVARSLAAKAPVDAARVAELRAAMVAGKYRVDPEAIAARMIAFDRGSGRG